MEERDVVDMGGNFDDGRPIPERVEDYQCEGCRATGFDGLHCGTCPHNEDRIRAYRRKCGS